MGLSSGCSISIRKKSIMDRKSRVNLLQLTRVCVDIYRYTYISTSAWPIMARSHGRHINIYIYIYIYSTARKQTVISHKVFAVK